MKKSFWSPLWSLANASLSKIQTTSVWFLSRQYSFIPTSPIAYFSSSRSLFAITKKAKHHRRAMQLRGLTVAKKQRRKKRALEYVRELELKKSKDTLF